jgi:hypothetical protein
MAKALNMKRSTVAIVAVAVIAAVAILGWYFLTPQPVEVAGTIIIRGYTQVLTYPTGMTWANLGSQAVYTANVWNIHGNVGSYNVSVPPGLYYVRVYFEGMVSPGSYRGFMNITVPGGNSTFPMNFEVT